MFENVVRPDDRNRSGVGIGPVLIDGQAVAVSH
jgi:hypothetical protein